MTQTKNQIRATKENNTIRTCRYIISLAEGILSDKDGGFPTTEIDEELYIIKHNAEIAIGIIKDKQKRRRNE